MCPGFVGFTVLYIHAVLISKPYMLEVEYEAARWWSLRAAIPVRILYLSLGFLTY